jgi:hypothetical protein
MNALFYSILHSEENRKTKYEIFFTEQQHHRHLSCLCLDTQPQCELEYSHPQSIPDPPSLLVGGAKKKRVEQTRCVAKTHTNKRKKHPINDRLLKTGGGGGMSFRNFSFLSGIFAPWIGDMAQVQVFAAGVRPEVPGDHVASAGGVGALRAAVGLLARVRPLVGAEVIGA